MWSKLSNVRRMIAKLLKTMNDVRKRFIMHLYSHQHYTDYIHCLRSYAHAVLVVIFQLNLG